MSQAASQHNLAKWYLPLAVLACAASLQALLLPRWPRATDLSGASIETALRSNGFNPVPLPALPPTRSYELASSTVLGYRLDGGEELHLVHVTVRERLKFDMNMISDNRPSMIMESAKISQEPPFSSTGRIQGRVARQTCHIAGMPGSQGFAVSQEQLWGAVDSVARENAAESLLRVIGMGSRRPYGCTLITLRARPGMPLPEARWQSVLRVLLPVLEDETTPTSARHTSHPPSTP